MMRRRQFITLLGGAAAWPLTARAQQAAVPVIGFLGSESRERWAINLRAFHQGLGETGYIEGRNVAVEYRWAEGHYERLPALASDLVRRQVDVLSAPGGFPSAVAAKAATSTIPIVFGVGADAVKGGLVSSLNRPGGNLTGVTRLNSELVPKRLELLREVVPAAQNLAVLVNPANPGSESTTKTALAAAGRLGLQLHIVHASTDAELEAAFGTIGQIRAGGVLIQADNFFGARSEELAILTVRHSLPAIFTPPFALAGGLIGYGADGTDSHHLVGIYTGRVLKGEKPADLPVQQLTKVDLTINLKTAKALGLTVPPTLLARADEVIE
jgi:putative ABC transport system substrate-binding protein